MKTQENSILDPFWKFSYFLILLLSKVSEKTYKQIFRKIGYRCTDGQMNGRTRINP